MINGAEFVRLHRFRQQMAGAVSWNKQERNKYAATMRAEHQAEFDKLSTDQFGTLLAVQTFKRTLTQENGQIPSPPHLTASYVASLAINQMPEVYQALTGLDVTDPDEATLRINLARYDAAMGIIGASAAVLLAEGEVAKGADKTASDIVDLHREVAGPTDVVMELAAYLKISRLAKDFARKLNDPTGTSLMEYVAPTRSNPPTSVIPTPKHMVREFFLIGAQFASKKYQAVYNSA